jgi:ABC-2 type transport system permease protein
MAFAGSAFLLLILGVAAGLGWGVTTGDIGSILPKVILMSISKIPSVWVIIGIVSLLYGLIPRASSVISWGLLGIFVIIEMAWESQMVDWAVMKLTPLAYAHYTIPVSQLSVLPLFWLTCLAGLLTYIGMLGFKRRSIG